MIDRVIEKSLKRHFFKAKSILLLGARQVGKTTLLRSIANTQSASVEWINADNPEDRALLNGINSDRAKQLFKPGTLVIIDEAQRLENTGLTLKIIHDACPEVQLVATGSSAFELTDKAREALTGRKWTYHLFPLSVEELANENGAVALIRTLETRLIYGSYPDVVNRAGEEDRVLLELANDYLFKDVFAMGDIRKPEYLDKLIKALAFQIGQEVSYRELASLTGLDKETVDRYIQLLEQAYVVFRLPSFARNLRNELKRSRKIYFYDVGIRNAVIQQFAPLEIRNDVGQLWENFLLAERIKFLNNHAIRAKMYFWRTHQQQEIDYIEERDSVLTAYEFKWNDKRKVRLPRTFKGAYPESGFEIVSRNNFLDLLLPSKELQDV